MPEKLRDLGIIPGQEIRVTFKKQPDRPYDFNVLSVAQSHALVVGHEEKKSISLDTVGSVILEPISQA